MWSVHKNSDKASQFECDHVMLAKNPENSIAVAMYHPKISDYPCSDTVGTKLREVVSSLPSYTLPVVQVSERVLLMCEPESHASNDCESACESHSY